MRKRRKPISKELVLSDDSIAVRYSQFRPILDSILKHDLLTRLIDARGFLNRVLLTERIHDKFGQNSS